MTIRRAGQNGIVALVCVASCLVVKFSGAADAKREKDGDEVASLRKAVLARFDSNHNGRLESKEKARAYHELLSRDESDDQLNALRDRVLVQFDKNGNGKLERSEVRTALRAVNSAAQRANDEQASATSARCDKALNSKQVARAVANDPSAAVAFTAQQLTSNGYDTATAEAMAIDKFDLNGDGVLDASELAVAQAQTLQQLASLATTASTITTPIIVTTGSGTTTTGTTSTGTATTGSSSSGSMAGGCSGSGSGSGSSGTSGSSTSTGSGLTNSAATRLSGQSFGNPSFASSGIQAFGGRRGR
jgi:hypothetical protein